MVFDEPKIVSEKEQEQSFTAFSVMEGLLDKLKLLKYEREFLNNFKIKPIHRYYFVVTKNPGEQFYLFSILAAWLIRKCGKTLEDPQEFDDPNETISKIVNEAKEIGIAVDFPASKLKQGVGEQVVYILDQLATHAVKRNNVILSRPKPPEEKEEETEVLEDESEINLDRVEEEMLAAYSDDSDEENLFHLDDLKPARREIQSSELKQNVDEESWKLELERVLPRLKVTIKNDNRDWRSHLEQMKSYKKSIDESLGTTKVQLEKLHKDIGTTLEKVTNREKYFNRELEDMLGEYRNLQDQLSKLKDNYKNMSGGIAERNRELQKLTDTLESIKQQMEERGNSMTDGTPLVNIKKSVAKVKSEIMAMDVRIGVLQCIILQSKLREEKQIEKEYGQTISVF